MSNLSKTTNTSQTSFYITDAFYENALNDVAFLSERFVPVSNELKTEIEQVLFEEARLVDELRLEEWLALYSEECLYWIPTVPGGGKPKEEVSIAFDDRRRLEDRVYRLRTGYAYSQLPLSRTRRMLTNIEITEGNNPKEIYVRTNFILYEFRVGEISNFAGWVGYKIVRENDDWKIAFKMVNLIDADQAHNNLTFIL